MRRKGDGMRAGVIDGSFGGNLDVVEDMVVMVMMIAAIVLVAAVAAFVDGKKPEVWKAEGLLELDQGFEFGSVFWRQWHLGFWELEIRFRIEIMTRFFWSDWSLIWWLVLMSFLLLHWGCGKFANKFVVFYFFFFFFFFVYGFSLVSVLVFRIE